ncbi:rhomboid family intramembrane serine protease [Flavobacterium sp. LB2P84]|uniref:rhomboid family intramembrane serine protease n=1 Tax=Flavobacterium yafengii TaxID=3041253 RepID=UPI0024A9AFF1|nr:rhomboid family intramembrane serine protease [Flavobacterium yafengii]MDI5898282.1 rhomboid family intramembrane serine protease [Flavobacterium yafengii]MDI6034053.1 rhomboid family intramembrane serine protease [Flavobacterium yafengii]MDI6046489.1 rhomboid family intramembrane serine protease [Flavobacterium yafengii]
MNIIDDLKLQYKMGGIVTQLIFWNAALFVFPWLFFALLSLFGVNIDYIHYVSLSSNPTHLLWKPWSLLSYAFFHSGIMHIIFNMIVLNFAGRLFMTYFTSKQLLGLYILSAIFAGICYILVFYVLNINAPIVGASAAIMAILVATTTYHPLMDLRLLIIGNVKLWHITAVIIIVDLMQLRSENMGGHISHLSGAFFGFIFIKLLQNGTDLSTVVTRIIDFFANLFKKNTTTPFKKVHKNYSKPLVKSVSKIVAKDKSQQQIDEILDKISQSGYDSLTKEEKEFLFKVGK